MIILNVSQKITEDFADFVRQFLEDNKLSESDVVSNSNGEISQGYINNLKNRLVLPESLTIKKVRALAHGFGVTEEEMFARVRGTYKRNTEKSVQINNYLNELSESRQIDLLEIAQLFFRMEKQSIADQIEDERPEPKAQKSSPPKKSGKETNGKK